MPDYLVDPHEVPPELEPDFEAARFTPEPSARDIMAGSSILERLDETMRTRVKELFR